MTQEEKDILLKDLSTRLPYGVKVQLSTNEVGILHEVAKRTCTVFTKGRITPPDFYDVRINDIKPYLFPLSSMTYEQIKEFNSLSDLCVDIYETSSKSKIFTICSKPTIGLEGETEFVEITQDDIISAIDWLNANHFDYRGLINKGLAIDATDLNIY
jgi:hypothetical protein|nr:MAG TPA: hypothetical protein [Bacteriophage sp.]DAO84925.1 MAG TPA: hypothetical protein [Caudoviricetes sp.]